MKGPTPRRLWKYVTRCLGLKSYLRCPGDGRVRPRIPAPALLWALLVGQLLREYAYHAVEALVCSSARRALGVSCSFGDDALGYFTERLNPAVTRAALATTLRRAKRTRPLTTAGSSAGRWTARRWGDVGSRPANSVVPFVTRRTRSPAIDTIWW